MFPGQWYLRSPSHGFRGNPRDFYPQSFPVPLEEMVDEVRNLFLPTAKGWEMNGDHGQPVVEVLPEQSLLGHAFQIPIRGRDDSNIHLGGGCSA